MTHLRPFALLLSLTLLVPCVAGLEIDHTPVERVGIGEPIPISVGIESSVPVERVDVVPSYSYGWDAFELNLTSGTDTHGRWYGEIPPMNKTGVMYYQIDIRFENGTNRVREYPVEIYSEPESTGWLDVPDNPWVLGIGAALLIGAMVFLEVVFRNRFFRRKNEDDGADRDRRKARKVRKK